MSRSTIVSIVFGALLFFTGNPITDWSFWILMSAFSISIIWIADENVKTSN